MSRLDNLARALQNLSFATDIQSRILKDPIVFPRRFADPRDIEIAGWLAASLAYGRVPLFQAAMEKILKLMEGKPYEYVRRFDPARDLKDFAPLYYRMNRGEDVACLIYFIQQIIQKYGSIGALFISLYKDSDPDIGGTLDRFIRQVQSIDTTPIYGKRAYPYGLSQFLSLPSKGSACKRLNLYLRWMIRPNDGLDFGIWKGIPPSKLVVPLDTHILRISRYLGFTRRRTSGWVTAQVITQALKRIDPEDPLRFDFPLCHMGISGNCPVGKSPEKCEACELLAVCAKGRMLCKVRPLN